MGIGKQHHVPTKRSWEWFVTNRLVWHKRQKQNDFSNSICQKLIIVMDPGIECAVMGSGLRFYIEWGRKMIYEGFIVAINEQVHGLAPWRWNIFKNGAWGNDTQQRNIHRGAILVLKEKWCLSFAILWTFDIPCRFFFLVMCPCMTFVLC